ncbi:hypothetical protein CH330_01475 [candidate division WOR-3 bacterium JGI_Cruoil_03_51_56]|uniref:Uncharacterized protein n=1 Tax=candidate division WOR-3 bacterium JGI_Cruoil_03_51_56 TaxID=1973747 RepID=A0A235BYV4_UNCW3|nr:MAG: hypothetical protein CH330_01475 [candidate division WOR-3 bacterium JGI_Cruoil_03_51_56]
MSKLEEYIEKKGEEAKKELTKKLRFRLTPKTKIVLPDITEVLVNDGIVEVGDVNAYEGMIVSLNIGDQRVVEQKGQPYIELKQSGRYRFYVIIDRLGDIEKGEKEVHQ